MTAESGSETSDAGILLRLTDRLYRATSKDEVFDAALEAICDALGCKSASILQFDEAYVMRFVAWRGLSEGYRLAVDGHSPWKAGQRDVAPIYVADILQTDEPTWLKEVIAQEGIRALAFVPIEAHAQVVGKFMSYFGSPHSWSERENEIAVTIARQVGFAVERWRAEEARLFVERELRLSEERFRLMSEDAPVMIWTSDSNGHCSHLNRLLRDFWGIDESAVATFQWQDTIHPEDAPLVASAMATALATRSRVGLMARYRSAEGGYRVLQTEARPNYAPDGKFMGMIGVNIDVTEKERAEKALRESERRFRDMSDAMPQLVWTADGQGRVDYCNTRVSEYVEGRTGTQGDFDWTSLIHPEDLESTTNAWNLALQTGQPYQIAHRLVMRNGDARWHLSRATAISDRGEVQKWFGTATDIDDLRRAEDRLKQSVKRQLIAVEGAGLGVFEWDMTTDRTIWENRRMYDIFGFDPDEPSPGKAEFTRFFLHPDDVPLLEESLRKAGQQDQSFRLVCRIMRKADRELRWLEVCGRFEFDASGQPVRLVGVTADITERKQLEEHQHLLINELNHRVKNTLGVVQSLAKQTFKTSDPATLSTFEGRLKALAHVHNLLAERSWERAFLGEVAREAVLSRPTDRTRIQMTGPEIQLSPRQALTIAMVLHELYTNACKYGALSDATGFVKLAWRDLSDHVIVNWAEENGPPCELPARRGFGSLLIEQALRAELQATVDRDFRPSGLVCTISIPLQRVMA
ncbi:PAS domain-containing protein [Mesorhizobium sp. AA23]|uniref:PAS domain-containing protein n=1 Tax=Mesorhizobium sp. AA23 TaxID=1854058 RepID=UPI0018D2DCCF|nr:PAS domain-containing protein [Mesorhizobium sp. AA23]